MKKKKSLPLLIYALFFLNIAHGQDISEDTLYIEEVVVSGTRIEVARKNVPITVSTVSRQQIERSNESAVLSVLSQRVPGMFVTERGVTGFGVGSGSAGQISMRGVGGTVPNTHVLVLIDGHPQYQGIFGHPFPDAYVSSDVEKVEVIRGPASILYGSNAMAGAINIITKKQTNEGFSGNARVSYGSYNTQKYMASGGFRDGRFTIFASVNHDRTDGHRDTSEFKIVNGFVKAGYEVNDNISVTGDFSIADFNSQDPGSIYNPAFFGIDIMRAKASLSVKNRYDRVEGGLIAFYNYGDHDFTDGWISQDYHAGVSLYQGIQLFKGNRVTAGVDYKNIGGIANRSFPLGAEDKWYDVTDIAGYTYMQQTLFDRLVLSAGIRLENNSLFGLETVPQTGFSYHVTDNTTIKGSLSKGFRSPSLMELYLFWPNQELVPEQMMNYELGIRRRCHLSRIYVEFTVFMIEGDNLIDLGPPPPPRTRQNFGSFSNKGVEMEVSWDATRNLSFASNYSYINLDRPRLAAPEHQFYLEGTYSSGKLRTNLSVRQVSGLYTFTGTDPGPQKENYTLVNLMLSYRFTGNIEVFASGKNLLNQEYMINYGYPMPKLTFFSGINLNLN